LLVRRRPGAPVGPIVAIAVAALVAMSGIRLLDGSSVIDPSAEAGPTSPTLLAAPAATAPDAAVTTAPLHLAASPTTAAVPAISTTAAPTTTSAAPTTTPPATTAAPTTTVAAAAPTAAEPVGLPVPAPPPTESYFDEPLVDLGHIEIPAIGLDTDLHQGISLYNIDRGPSHWPGTALPGQRGNVVVAGHRVTKGAPFRHIDQLVPGDQVIFEVAGVRSVYVVTDDEVVTPDGVHIVDQTEDYTATLFACHPPGSAAYRYVVHLAYDPVASQAA
jgi:sortase A